MWVLEMSVTKKSRNPENNEILGNIEINVENTKLDGWMDSLNF
jgi:hypothetical protein